MKNISVILILFVLVSCQKHQKVRKLPLAVTNNAVALISNNDLIELYTFNGLLAGKTWQDITNRGFKYKNGHWSEINISTQNQAVLASTAVSVENKIYLIGGYTVDEKGQEVSTKNILQFDTIRQEWSALTQIPTPVDDTVALVYANRYIYLISGWHDTANVNLVQVYDLQEGKWFNATNFPAPAVFGHSGGIVNNKIIICDGVKLVLKDKKRDFLASPICLKGKIDKNNPQIIHWQSISHHSQRAYYRMAATGDLINNRIVFAGGSDNPYNFNGIGYNKIPSEASNKVFSFEMESDDWREFENLIKPSMDHRSLLYDGKWFYIIGGMKDNQKVSNKLIKFIVPK